MTIHYLNGNSPYCGHPCWSGHFAGSSKSEEVTCLLCLRRMAANSKVAKAQEMRAHGLSRRDIAKVIGLPYTTDMNVMEVADRIVDQASAYGFAGTAAQIKNAINDAVTEERQRCVKVEAERDRYKAALEEISRLGGIGERGPDEAPKIAFITLNPKSNDPESTDSSGKK